MDLPQMLLAFNAKTVEGERQSNLPLILAGKAQGGLKHGRFVQCKSGTLNSNMWLTLAQLMGLEINTFADSTGVISDLWT